MKTVFFRYTGIVPWVSTHFHRFLTGFSAVSGFTIPIPVFWGLMGLIMKICGFTSILRQIHIITNETEEPGETG